MKELFVTAFLRQILEQHRTRPDHPFCWILGAGASVSSDIPTAGDLAREFLACLCENATGSKDRCDQWIKSGALQIDGFDPLDPAKHYPELYERRYGDCPDAGYAFLEDKMRDKRPSYGYAVLALLLEKTRHQIVITINFDNLVADAIAAHSATFPRVVGHPELTQFVQPEGRRPLIAKVHGDLGFPMCNTRDEIARLDERWQEALARILGRRTPIVIGYGGNDRTLMRLLSSLPPKIPDRVYWCQWKVEQPAPHVIEYLATKEGAYLVPHAGFDALMMQIEVKLREDSSLGLPPNLVDHLRQRQTEHLASFKQSEALGVAIARPQPLVEQVETDAEAKERQALAVAAVEALAGGGALGDKPKPWWAWELEARAAPTIDARDEVYRAAIREWPQEAALLGNYANFLRQGRGDLDRAADFYERAIEAAPKDANNLYNYATFLFLKRGDLDRAEGLFKRAIEADPRHANSLGAFAVFLWKEGRDLDRAEEFFRRAIEADPRHANNLGNHAIFLWKAQHDLDRAEELFRRAIDAGPKHGANLGNYADFLWEARRDQDRAAEFYKRAIEADPKYARSLGHYAGLLLANARTAEGTEKLAEAFAASGLRDDLPCGLWFYAYAHCADRWPDALGRLKGLLESGVRAKGWDFSANVCRARADGHPEADLVAALADVVSEKAEIADLDRFATWQSSKSIPPDAIR